MISKIQQLENNESFLRELDAISTPDELSGLLKGYGVELSRSEMNAIFAQASVLSCGDELDDETMDMVAGGVAWAALAGKVGWWLVKTVAVWAVKKGVQKVMGW